MGVHKGNNKGINKGNIEIKQIEIILEGTQGLDVNDNKGQENIVVSIHQLHMRTKQDSFKLVGESLRNICNQTQQNYWHMPPNRVPGNTRGRRH